VSVKALPQRDDLLEGDAADQHPIAIALRRQDDVDERVTTFADSRLQNDGRVYGSDL
jgi:hypothetical protein